LHTQENKSWKLTQVRRAILNNNASERSRGLSFDVEEQRGKMRTNSLKGGTLTLVPAEEQTKET